MNKVFLFSGQGSQEPGMFKNYYDKYDCVKEIFLCANNSLGRDIRDLIFYGTQKELNQTINTQPAMLCIDLSISSILHSMNVLPKAVAGFSLGEYASLVEAGSIELSTAFRLIDIRAHAMAEAVTNDPCAMLAVSKLTEEKVEELVVRSVNETNKYASIVNYNSPLQYVVAGYMETIIKIEEYVKINKGRSARLQVSAPFHSKFMEHARRVLEKEFLGIKFNDAKIPIYMNYDGKPHFKNEEIKDLVLKQTSSPVRWLDTMNNMVKDGYNDFIECGYGDVLTKLMKRTYEDVNIVDSSNL